jgi:hypothetical protein
MTIRINIHPARENPIHMTCTLLASVQVRHTYAFYGQSTYVVTFHVNSTESDKFTAPEKKCCRLHLSAQLNGPWDPPQFLSQHNHLSSMLKLNIYWRTCYIGLLGSYHQHVISTFNTCSQGPTHRSLTDTGGGLQFWRCRLTTSHSPTFSTDDPPLFN